MPKLNPAPPVPSTACTLLTRTIELVRTCGKSPGKIAAETGLSVYWITSLRYDTTKEPSVNKIVMLYEYLSGKKLEVN